MNPRHLRKLFPRQRKLLRPRVFSLYIFFSFIYPTSLFSQKVIESPLVQERLYLQALEKHFIENEFSKMVQKCLPALKKYKNSMAFHYVCGLGFLYLPSKNIAQRNQNMQKSISLLKEADHFYSLNPRVREKYINLLFHLGLAWQLAGNREMAIYNYRRLLVYNDRKTEALYNLAVCYEETGKIIDANLAYRRYLKVEEEGEEEF